MKQKYLLKNGREFSIVSLTVDQLDEILILQRKVIESLSTGSFLQPLTEEEFSYILNGKGLMIGAYYNEQLIAFRAMLEPELDEEHLGKDARLPRSEWPLVLYSEISNVDPEFQGNGLQVLLGKHLMKEVVHQQRFRYICTTVAPFNIASLKDKFAHGMQIVELKVKYDNLLRYILMKDLALPFTEKDTPESRYVLMADTEEQQLYLRGGWRGTKIELVDDQWVVRFEK
ncbi:GNAT family N-acetyltransferase [Sporosarcina sp. ANT_H38]|uniref:GNAT family N-acetyltransferase n=1 Tax=Sporosarcina sp. ANT_H38 TaxID=2597358 RepID=UPI0011F3C2F6|nr:GNAT family N-acetyltransferase [Sporosarcina sp. ANT_H38]KAA0964900.1 GNAT family N-acetyltransferase [Sporosarcina sp. ANT_H38]